MNNAGILPSPKAIAGYKLASLPFEFKPRTRCRAGDQNEGGPQFYGWLGRDSAEESRREASKRRATQTIQAMPDAFCRTGKPEGQ